MSKTLNIEKIFKKIKVKKTDLVMLHVDSAILYYYSEGKIQERIKKFCEEILDYFHNSGTIIVPTFTYSFAKKKNYNPKTSKSDVGYFSEIFRKIPNVRRTNHPLFSIAVKGKLENNFLGCTTKDSFGKNTIFDLLYKKKGKIICIACDLERITFMHYIEQKFNVPYRYFKNFHGFITENKKKKKTYTRYYVRDLKENYIMNLSKLEKYSYLKKSIKNEKFKRFYFKSIEAKVLHDSGLELLKKDKYYFVKNEI